MLSYNGEYNRSERQVPILGRAQREFQYPNRLLRNEFRLLTLLPETDSEQRVRCEMARYPLDECPSYEAVSYVWGDRKITKKIILNGKPFPVTNSVYAALKRLRLSGEKRTLWIDAISINQQDVKERNHQVSDMGHIYSHSSRVVVWLGTENVDEAPAALKSMEIIVKACKEYEKNWIAEQDDPEQAVLPYTGDRLGYDFYREVLAVEEEYNELDFEALETFFDLTYFQRMWCVQEIRLAKEVICFWGEHELSWSAIGITAAWVEDMQYEDDDDPGELVEDINVFPVARTYDRESPSLPLFDALCAYRELEATDPRDKVYGLLGFVKPGPEVDDIVVSYERGVGDLYADVALSIIRHTGNLEILAWVVPTEDEFYDKSFSSWAPRWDISEPRSQVLFNWPENDTWNTCDNEQIRDLHLLSPEPGCLRLSGLLFDRVADLRDTMDIDDLKEADDEDDPPEQHPFLNYWNEVLSGLESGSTEGENVWKAMAQTLTAALDSGLDLVRELPQDEIFDYFAEFLGYIDHLFTITGQENTTSFDPSELADKFAELAESERDKEDGEEDEEGTDDSETPDVATNEKKRDLNPETNQEELKPVISHANDIHASDPNANVESQASGTESKENGTKRNENQDDNTDDSSKDGANKDDANKDDDSEDGDNEDDDSEEDGSEEDESEEDESEEDGSGDSDDGSYIETDFYKYVAIKVCDNRRLFKTKNGSWGLGPSDMKEDDMVVVLFGGDTPHIIRDLDGEWFTYVGQAYVHDLMDGQLVKDWRDGKAELKEFILR